MVIVKKRTLSPVFSFFYAAILALFCVNVIFWIKFSSPSSDIHNYLLNYDRFSQLFYGSDVGPIGFVTNELSFHYLFELLSNIFYDPLLALKLLTFLSVLLIVSLSFSGKTIEKSIVNMAVFLHPRFFDFVSSQQRLAIAIAVFMLAMQLRNKVLMVALFFISASFHTYVFVLVIAIIIYRSSGWIKTILARKVFAVLSILSIVFFSVVLQEVILDYLGDRRTNMEAESAGAFYTLMWLMTFIVVFWIKKNLFIDEYGYLCAIEVLSSLVAFLLGGYSERFFPLSLIFFAFSTFRSGGLALISIMAVIVINISLSYYYWV